MRKASIKTRRICIAFLAVIMAFAMSATAFGATSTDEALQIALDSCGLSKSEVKNIEVEKDGKTIDVEFTRKSNKAEYDFEISAKDGKIFEKSIEYKYKKTKSKKKIGKKKARKIAAKTAHKSYDVVKKGTCKYTYKKKLGKYEVKFRSGDYKYEVEMLAKNGKLIEYEYEYTGTR